MTTIKVKSRPSAATIKVNLVSNGIINTNSVKILSSTPLSSNRLDTLEDVVEGQSPPNNSTLVYNSETDKYEVKLLDLDDVTSTLDSLEGGEF